MLMLTQHCYVLNSAIWINAFSFIDISADSLAETMQYL